MNFSQECLSKKFFGYCIGYHTVFLNLKISNVKTEQILIQEIQNYKNSLEKIYKPWQIDFWKDKWARECPQRSSINTIQPFHQVFLIENEDNIFNNSEGNNDIKNVKISNYSTSSQELSTDLNNSQEIILKDWRLILSKNSQLFIIGTIDGLQITWSEMVVKVLGSFKLLTPNNVVVLLVGPLVDHNNSMPRYIKNKFLYGFKSDWLDSINLWFDYEKRGRPNSFIWNKNATQSDFSSPIIIQVREPKPSLSSTSVNFSEFNEISTLNDTVKMDDDESELIIESRLKNDQSLSSTITSEPSNNSFSSIDIILISNWTPYFNPKLKIIGIKGITINQNEQNTQIQKMVSKMVTNMHFRSTDGYICKLVGGLYDPFNEIPAVVKKIFQKNLLTHLSKIIKTWSNICHSETSGVNDTAIEINKRPILDIKKENTTKTKRKSKEIKIIPPRRPRNSKDTTKKTPCTPKAPVKKKISLKGKKKELKDNNEIEIIELPIKRFKQEIPFSPEV